MQQQIFNVMVEFFEEDGWEFQWMEGISVLSMGYSGQNGKWMCYAQAREPQQQFVFYSVISANAPEQRRHDVAEYITRANYGMVMGNFEMDFKDGEIRYKTSIDVEGSQITMPLIRQVVYANLVITDRYLPGLMQVIYAGITPLEALAGIEDLSDLPGVGGNDDDSSAGDEMSDIDADDDLDDLFSEADDDDVDDDEYDDTFGYLDDYENDDISSENDEDEDDDPPENYNPFDDDPSPSDNGR